MLSSEPPSTRPEPVANGLPTVAQLLPHFEDWLAQQRDESPALALLRALAGQSKRVAGMADIHQLEFNAQDLVQACDWPEGDDFAAASRKLKRANIEKYLDGRRYDFEEFFRAKDLEFALKVSKRSPNGRHRAQWYLEPFLLPPLEGSLGKPTGSEPLEMGSGEPELKIRYDHAGAGTVKLSRLARLLFGNGWFSIRSLRGVLFLGIGLVPIFGSAILVFLAWMMMFVRRPLMTADLAAFVFIGGLCWLQWLSIRSLWWLVADRIVPASEMLLGWGENQAQVEIYKHEKTRFIGLVRYSGTCPVCAAEIELRYGEGHERRRLFGCCVEAPQEHVFTFDRVTREGRKAR